MVPAAAAEFRQHPAGRRRVALAFLLISADQGVRRDSEVVFDRAKFSGGKVSNDGAMPRSQL